MFTPVQTVWLESDRPPPAPGGAGHLFTVWDKRWISGMSGLIRKTGQGTWLDSVLLRDGSQCVLLLPDELEGDYELAVDSSGNKDNMIELLITLKSPGKIQSKKFDPPLPSGGLIPVGRVAVRRGRAEIHLAASRTERWNGEEEASCEFRSILLTPVYRERDALPPEVVVLYPPADHRVSGADAVVFASPTYKATYTGLLKLFLDQIPYDGLAGVIGLPLMLGAAPNHALAPEFTLKPVLVELGAICPAPGLYLLDSNYAEDPALNSWIERTQPLLRAIAS